MILSLQGLTGGTLVWSLTHAVGVYSDFASETVHIRGHDSRILQPARR
jgi:hypothetical protein